MRLQAHAEEPAVRRDPQQDLSPAEGIPHAPAATLASAICARMRAEILSGERRPHARIRLEDLKAEFSVSWSPLREALSRLVAEGLVRADENRGYWVAPVSRAEMADITRMRMAMESMAVQLAIEHGDDAWEAGLLAAYHRLSKFEARRQKKADAEQWEHWHREFHDAVARGCGSPILLQFCAQLQDQFARYRKLFLAVNPFDKRVPGEHKALLEAAIARNADKACAIIEEHIGRTGRNILAAIKE